MPSPGSRMARPDPLEPLLERLEQQGAERADLQVLCSLVEAMTRVGIERPPEEPPTSRLTI